ncbi:MAG: hypothetical protein ACRDU5_00620 [Mycobacterium sp.]
MGRKPSPKPTRIGHCGCCRRHPTARRPTGRPIRTPAIVTEIPLVFGTLDSPVGLALCGQSPVAKAVSAEMSSAWRSFATDGDPGWPNYDPVEQLTRVFDAEPGVERYPEQASQQIWANHQFDPFPLQH